MYSRGGVVDVPWVIASMIREFGERWSVLIAYRSFPDDVRRMLTQNGPALLVELAGEWWLQADAAAFATRPSIQPSVSSRSGDPLSPGRHARPSNLSTSRPDRRPKRSTDPSWPRATVRASLASNGS